MLEAHPITGKHYQFPEFDFLLNPPRKWTHHSIQFDSNSIVGTVNTVQIANPKISNIVSKLPTPQPSTINPIGINPIFIHDLLRMASPSMFGRGNDTVHDEEIRASSEISAEHITLYPEFTDYIKQVVSLMAIQLGNCTAVEPQFYKLIIYKEGDHFEDHIDNQHIDNMIMTLSVEFPIPIDTERENYLKSIAAFNLAQGVKNPEKPSTDNGGDLTIEEEIIPHPEPNHLGLTLFYHDTHHKVTPVKRGYRMSLIFDVIQNPEIVIPEVIQQYMPSFQLGIDKLRNQGVNRIGSPCNHIYILPENYIPDNTTWQNLKGMDRIFWELLRSLGDENYIEGIVLSDNKFYFDALVNIMQLEEGFRIAYYYQDHEEQIVDQHENVETNDVGSSAITDYRLIKLRFDERRNYRAVHPKYKMGNVVILKSKGNFRLTYQGNTELHTGNQGFEGDIYSNLGLFADF
jgi:predicted 2-oxoglutarate/Fe(II)-dependent dioxygenase YbiX